MLHSPATANIAAMTGPNHHDHLGHGGRKRKAESQDNERLSKRLSLLNLEQHGHKLYVPVENPAPSQGNGIAPPSTTPMGTATSITTNGDSTIPPVGADDDAMYVDDSKHKVYIYSIDDELSSSDSEEPDGGRLVFLPDIERHLRARRIPFVSPASPPVPRPVPVNPEGELAGMQVVLYREPESLTVPVERDNVRKAIVESRARTRERQRREREGNGAAVEMPPRVDPSVVRGALAGGSEAQEQDNDSMDLD